MAKDLLAQDSDLLAILKQKFPQLSKKDLDLCNLLTMDLSTKEIAPIIGVSDRGIEISRYRLRKKLGLRNDVVLSDYLKDLKNV